MSKTKKKQPRKCKVCGQPERLYLAGLYSNLSPYTRICTDCINKASK